MRSNSKNVKRVNSPYNQKDVVSDKKKRTSPFDKKMKEIQVYSKNDKKKKSNIIKSSVHHTQDKILKLFTQPIESPIMDLAKISLQEGSLSRNNPRSRKKLHSENRQSSKQIKSNLQKKSTSPEVVDQPFKCPNCARYREELDYLERSMKKMINLKNRWKTGETTLQNMKDYFFVSVDCGAPSKNQYKVAESMVSQLKKELYDFMTEIESLSFINYPKMLSLDIFSYDHSYSEYEDGHEKEIKDFLQQLRSHMEGKITEYDTQDTFNDSTYTRQIIRNLKARLSHALRENLQLRMKKGILEKAEEISQESEEYLRKVIESVLEAYVMKQI